MSERTLYHYNADPEEHSSIRDSFHMTVAQNLHHEDAREIVKRWNEYPELKKKVEELEEELQMIETIGGLTFKPGRRPYELVAELAHSWSSLNTLCEDQEDKINRLTARIERLKSE